METLLQDI